MLSISRRIKKLEEQKSATSSSGHTIALSELDPAVAAIFFARNCDVAQMTLAELDALERELRRFTV